MIRRSLGVGRSEPRSGRAGPGACRERRYSERDVGTVLVVEAEFEGYTHATFNSFFLEAVHYAFPECTVIFAAEPRHLDEVQRALFLRGIDDKPLVHCRVLATGRREGPSREQEFRIAKEVASLARSTGADLMLITSATWTQLLRLSLAGWTGALPPTIVALHSHADYFESRGLRGRLTAALRRTALDRVSPICGLVVFSAHARLAAEGVLRLRRVPVVQVDPPYGPGVRRVVGATRTRGAGPTLGWLGRSSKGDVSSFAGVARRVKQRHPDARFLLVGSYSGEVSETDLCAFSVRPSQSMLNTEQYCSMLSELTHGVLWARGSDYQNRISAAFLDAIVNAIPGIYLSSPFLEEFFRRFGECGVLCASEEEMEAAIVRACRGEDEPLYPVWKQNMERARTALAPSAVGAELRQKIRELRVRAATEEIGD